MKDVDDQIRRLDALRAAGAISEAEYGSEAARIRNGSTSIDPVGSVNEGSKPHIRWLIIAVVFLALAGGVFVLGRHDGAADALQEHEQAPAGPVRAQGEQSAPANPTKDDQPPLAPDWAFRTAVDPLTDLPTTAAFSRFPAGPFFVNVTIGCKGNKSLAYQLMTFDQEGNGAALRTTLGGDADMLETATYTLRLDKGEAVSVTDRELRFNNAVAFASKQDRVPTDGLTAHAAAARSIVAQIHLEAGDATIVVDQGSPQVRSFLDRCLAGMMTDAAARARDAVAQCEAYNADLRDRVNAARAAYRARDEPIPAYLGDEGTPVRVDQSGNGLRDCAPDK